MPKSLVLTPSSRTRSPGVAAWIAFLSLGGWLILLVVAPTVVLIIYSFCDVDPDLGTPIYRFTLDNYKMIFDPSIAPVLWRTAAIAACTAIALVTIVAMIRRRFSVAALRYGLLLGGGVYLSYAIRHLPDDVDGAYLQIFWRSAEIAGFTTLACLLVGYPVAFFIGRSSPLWRNRLLMLVMIPFWTSFLIRTYAWMTILNEHGLLNGSLRGLHLQVLIPDSGAILYTPAAAVIGLIYAYLPFMILPIYGSVEKIDNSLIEASMDLGASPLRTLRSVIFPLTSPGVVAGILLVFVPAIGMFAITDLLSGNKLPTIGSRINDQFNQGNNQPLGAALGVTLMCMFGFVFLVTGSRRPSGVA
jgi:spermidine/putrescine transport system permease protein